MNIIYFAYGSNMSVRRISARITSAMVLGTAVLNGHRLGFRKVGKDGSAKCDIEHTSQTEHDVIGVMFRLLSSDKHVLNHIEGLGSGYEEKTVSVQTGDGHLVKAQTYYATNIDDSLLPYYWYREHVLAGAREHALPADYIHMIESIETIRDPDVERHIRELSIYT